MHIVLTLLLSFIFSFYGYYKKSLSLDGALTAFFVGVVHGHAGFPFFVTLAVFFFSSSFLTKYKSNIKKNIEADFKEGGQRNFFQVIANSLPAIISCLLFILYRKNQNILIHFEYDPLISSILLSFIGHYSCCNGDTWSSELGVLSHSDPYLITTMKRVPKGTNGGISFIGTISSILGGFSIGFSFFICSMIKDSNLAISTNQWIVILIATLSGLIGSLIDSLMGATIQYSGWDNDISKVVSRPSKNVKHISGLDILSNHSVNFLTSIIMSILTPIISFYLFSQLLTVI